MPFGFEAKASRLSQNAMYGPLAVRLSPNSPIAFTANGLCLPSDGFICRYNSRISLMKSGAGEGLRMERATVPMSASAREMLLRAKEGALTEFVIEWGGKRVLNCRKGFDLAAQRSELSDVTPHVLGPTAAVWMAESQRRSMRDSAQRTCVEPCPYWRC